VIRKTLDKIVIPPLLKAQTLFWLNKFPELSRYSPQRVFLDEGHQTKDYLRYRINKYYPINDSRVLLLGCGKGEEVRTWLEWNPREIEAIDYFDYSKEWANVSSALTERWKGRISFQHIDILSDHFSLNDPFDIISSDAVLEHITDLRKALSRLSTLLTSSGILYAGFGPLYYTFGGDHYSGWDSIENGFHHLLLEREEYEEYVAQMHSDKKGFDDRILIHNGLFNWLKADEYIDIIKDYFQCIDLRIGISAHAMKFRKLYPLKWGSIIDMYNLREIDLLAKCIFIVARRNK
jgi:SAM-dependent methyltransferase